MAALIAPTSSVAQETEPRDYLDGLPPLQDLETFFGDPEYANASLSPEGTYLAFRRPYEGVMNIWVKEVGASFDDARPLTAEDRPIPGFFWSQNEEHILFVNDEGGDENFNVFAVDPTAEPAEGATVPEARNLTPIEDVRAQIYDVPRERPGELFVGLNDRDASYHDVYRVDIATGERELIQENTEEVGSWHFDLEGVLRLATREMDDGSTEILRIDDDAMEQIYTCTVEESCSPIRFHPDGERVYLRTNAGDDVDRARLTLMEVATGAEEVIESDPEGEVDLAGAIFSNANNELLATAYQGDRQRIYPQSESFAHDLEHLRNELPDGELGISSRTYDEAQWTVSLSRDVDPGTTYRYDREQGTLEELYQSRPEIDTEQMAEMKPIRYTARDGLEIPAYLTIPQGVEPEDLSVVVLPHGGPWARDTWGYDPYAQFFANRGYAVFQPNFRGSTGFGQEFLNAGNKEWGTGAMQHDITDGVQYLIDEGIADPDHVGIFGGSYGGYATLAGLTFTPDVYAAGISFVGPSNLITLINSIPPYWASVREMMHQRVGNPDDPEDRARMKAQSPVFHADEIRAPLMVIQGANDPRVLQSESDQIVVAMREQGFDVEYLLAKDEGHGFRDETNRMASVAAMESFFAEHLGGRQQTDPSKQISDRLAELRVDVDTVELPDTLAISEAESAALPQAHGNRLSEGTVTYASEFETPNGTMELTAVRSLEAVEQEDGSPIWRIVNETEMPMGTSVDTLTVDRETLKPYSLHSEAPQATLRLDYSDDQITGEIEAGGRQMAVDEELDAPVFGFGAALEITLATLDLEPGFETPIRYYDPQQQALRLMQLTVHDATTTEVPAGTFDTWRVTMDPLDEQGGATTFFVRQSAPHHVIKSETELPGAMGGGTATTVLEEHTW